MEGFKSEEDPYALPKVSTDEFPMTVLSSPLASGK
jgi:hypothetical protein